MNKPKPNPPPLEPRVIKESCDKGDFLLALFGFSLLILLYTAGLHIYIQNSEQQRTTELQQIRQELEEAKLFRIQIKQFLDKLNIEPEQTITYYAPYDNKSGICSDGNPNNTATGAKPKEGTMAVNPAVIPYGAEIALIYKDGRIERGRAEDTGGAIRASRSKVDVFRWTHEQAIKDGKREATAVWIAR
jgi:3D (Asp-Asp-Asp) domain-containing protein